MAKQVVVSVNFSPGYDTNKGFTETEFERVNAYLKQGYKVIQAYPIALGHNSYAACNITFVLEKSEV